MTNWEIEFRVTRPGCYTAADCTGRSDVTARQGHYYRCPTAKEAVAKAAEEFKDLVFDVQQVRGKGIDPSHVTRFTRDGEVLP